jgi:tetratricopeptide (TPR) repeat protein
VAINKKQSSIWVKAVLVFVALAFIVSLLPQVFLGNKNGAKGEASASGAGAVLESIANEHLPAVTSYTSALASEPTSYTALVGLGNTYFDWGAKLQEARQALGDVDGHDLPMWLAAAAAYDRALTIKPGDPSVGTDMAISLYYAAQTDRAIEVIEGVRADAPDFGPAYFNAGVFYRGVGENAKAIAAFERYLELEPEGASAPPARSMLSELQGASTGETTGTP